MKRIMFIFLLTASLFALFACDNKTDTGTQELRNNTRPALASHVENMDKYDVIFLGYPNWWGTLPQAVLTFLEEYDFSGKTVIPFCTYEDSPWGGEQDPFLESMRKQEKRFQTA